MAAKKNAGGPFEALRALKEELSRQEAAAASKKAKSTEGGARVTPTPPRPPRSPSDQGFPRTPSDSNEEALLFHRNFAGVKPLDRSRGRGTKQPVERSHALEEAAKRGRETERAEADAVHEHLRALVEGRARFEVSDDGQYVEGRRVDLPREALRRLRRGLVPIDVRTDLHGLGVDQARAQLELFLRTTRARGERCALVVHGKGEHSPGGVGVLRGEIAAWLSQGPASEHVAGFATATSHDGGGGAVYVLLRR